MGLFAVMLVMLMLFLMGPRLDHWYLPVLAAAAALLLVGSRNPFWALPAVAAVMGVPQGLNGLATQNALYRQADPARTASAAGLLRTFGYLGALAASAATAAFFTHRADTPGLHSLALFMLAGSALLLATTLPDRSLSTLVPTGKA